MLISLVWLNLVNVLDHNGNKTKYKHELLLQALISQSDGESEELDTPSFTLKVTIPLETN